MKKKRKCPVCKGPMSSGKSKSNPLGIFLICQDCGAKMTVSTAQPVKKGNVSNYDLDYIAGIGHVGRTD